MKQVFGVFDPQYELVKNIPKIIISKVLLPDSLNVLLKDGKIVRRKMREKNLVTAEAVKVRTPDSNPVLCYHTFVKRSTGSQYLLGFTKAHIYCWNWDNKEWDIKFTCSADCENWEVKSYNDKVVATNNVDMVLVWDTTGYFMPLQNTTPTNITAASKENPCHITAAGHNLTTGDRVFIKDVVGMTEINNLQFVVTVDSVDVFSLDGVNSSAYTTYTSGGTVVEFQGIEYETGYFLTKAKYMTDYENFLILGYTYENGNYYPQRFRWNAIGDETEWIATNSGSTEVGKSDCLMGFGKYQGLLIVYKANSYYKYWLTADTVLVFNGTFISMTIGNRCSKSIVNDNKGRLYWYASDGTFKEISVGTISQPIQTDIVDKIYQSSVENMRSEFIDETEEVCWAVPIDNELNNLLLTFKESKWGQVEMAVTAFGGYRQP